MFKVMSVVASSFKVVFGTMQMVSVQVADRTGKYAPDANADTRFTGSNLKWIKRLEFVESKNQGDVFNHVFINKDHEHQTIDLGQELILGVSTIDQLPNQVQTVLVDCQQHKIKRENDLSCAIDLMREKIEELLDKYPTAIYTPVSGCEYDYYDGYIKMPFEYRDAQLRVFIKVGRNEHRQGTLLMDLFEKTLANEKRGRDSLLFIIDTYKERCHLEDDYVYVTFEDGIVAHLRLSYLSGYKDAHKVLLDHAEDLRSIKSKNDAKQKAINNAILNKNEAFANIILKRFPKAQIVKEGLKWTVNGNKVDLYTFCKQNKIIIPKHLL